MFALAWSATALAQFMPAAPQSQAPVNPACQRLEGQLAAIERGQMDPSRAAQIRRSEEAVARQQADLDRAVAQQRRLGCQNAGGIFSLFTGGVPPQCNQINSQIDQMRSNLDRLMSEQQRSQASGGMEGERQAVLAALSQNNCGPQYRAAQRGLFESILGGGGSSPVINSPQFAGTFRTVCVRTCDGYYYPISFATTSARFREDEEICRNTCPNAEVALYAHRNQGEDMRNATALNGRPYTELPNAFRYRQQFDETCSCRKPGQTWAEALSGMRDTTIERGDIVVSDPKARQRPATPPAAAKPASRPSEATPAAIIEQRSVRTVGPSPYPVR
jgi:hypothetical protein